MSILFIYLLYWAYTPTKIKETIIEEIPIQKTRECVFKDGRFIYYSDNVFEISTYDCGIYWVNKSRFKDFQFNNIRDLLKDKDTITIGYELSQSDIFPRAIYITKGTTIILKRPTTIKEIIQFEEKEIQQKLLPFIVLISCILLLYLMKIEHRLIIKKIPESKLLSVKSDISIDEFPLKINNYRISKIQDTIVLDKLENLFNFKEILKFKLEENKIKILYLFRKREILISDIKSLIVYIRRINRNKLAIATIFVYLNNDKLIELFSIQEKEDIFEKDTLDYIGDISTKIATILSAILKVEVRKL